MNRRLGRVSSTASGRRRKVPLVPSTCKDMSYLHHQDGCESVRSCLHAHTGTLVSVPISQMSLIVQRLIRELLDPGPLVPWSKVSVLTWNPRSKLLTKVLNGRLCIVVSQFRLFDFVLPFSTICVLAVPSHVALSQLLWSFMDQLVLARVEWLPICSKRKIAIGTRS